MKQFLVIFSILIFFASFSQGKIFINHTENPNIEIAIKLHDSLVEKFRKTNFSLFIDSIEVYPCSYLYKFYSSKEIFLNDSLHAKKQMKVLNELAESDGCGSSMRLKILNKAREYKRKGQNEKALEYYKRGLILVPEDQDFKKEYEALIKEIEKK